MLKIRLFIVSGGSVRKYRIVVCDSLRQRQSGAYIEQIGTFDHKLKKEYKKKEINLDFHRAKYWIGQGAIVTPAVQRIFAQTGILPPNPNIIPRDWDLKLVDKSKKSIMKWYEQRKELLGEEEAWPT